MTTAAQPLRGCLSHIRVLDLSRVFAGPWSGQMLADLDSLVAFVEQQHTGLLSGGSEDRSQVLRGLPEEGREVPGHVHRGVGAALGEAYGDVGGAGECSHGWSRNGGAHGEP